jgi:hypothetical protein
LVKKSAAIYRKSSDNLFQQRLRAAQISRWSARSRNIPRIPTQVTMPQLRISAFELNHHDRALISSLLELAQGKTRSEWFWVDNISVADVVIATATTDTRHAIEERLAHDGGPPSPIYLVNPQDAMSDRLYMLRPPRLADIIRCLNAAQVLIETRKGLGEKPDITEFSSIYPALVAMYRSRATGLYVIRGKPWAPIHILPSQRTYFSVADDDTMRATLTRTEGAVTVEAVTDEPTLLQLVQQIAEPAAKLIWLAAITLPHAHQIGYIDPKKMYQLKRIPKLDGLMHREADVRMANILSQTAMTARGLALLSGASTSGARSFLMATYAAGMLSAEKSRDDGFTDSRDKTSMADTGTVGPISGFGPAIDDVPPKSAEAPVASLRGEARGEPGTA